MKTLSGIGMLAIMVLAGCASNEVGILCPISGGETITVILTPQGPVLAENEDFKVVAASFAPNIEQKQLIYAFALLAKKGKAPKHVSVEDVSEEKIELLVDDAGPQLDAKQIWLHNAPPKTATDPRLAWLYYEGNSTRVYRFKIVTDDGRQLVMYQASIVPVFIKGAARKILGMAP